MAEAIQSIQRSKYLLGFNLHIYQINIIIYIIALLRYMKNNQTLQAPVVATGLIKQFLYTRTILKAEIIYVTSLTCPTHNCRATIVVSAAISSYEKRLLILSILAAVFVIV